MFLSCSSTSSQASKDLRLGCQCWQLSVLLLVALRLYLVNSSYRICCHVLDFDSNCKLFPIMERQCKAKQRLNFIFPSTSNFFQQTLSSLTTPSLTSLNTQKKNGMPNSHALVKRFPKQLVSTTIDSRFCLSDSLNLPWTSLRFSPQCRHHMVGSH